MKGFSDSKPLTSAQWKRLRDYLEENNRRPRDLFHGKEIVRAVNWGRCRRPSEGIIEQLLDRGVALSLALQKWADAGLWVLTYLDDDYPWRLKKRLSTHSDFPSLIFGVGSRKLLQLGGLAVVGSRKPPKHFNPEIFEEYYLDYAKSLGGVAAEEGVIIISGGALGVDINSMRGALESGGKTVGVLTDQLLKKSNDNSFWQCERKIQDCILDGQLTLVSVTDPEKELRHRPYGWAAMQRNKYIYALSDAAVVVRSGEKGGTWSGAVENLKNSWVPLWVKKQHRDDIEAANEKIVGMNVTEKKASILPEDEGINNHIRSALQERDIRKATILLTINLSSDRSDQANPLDYREWGRFTKYLLDQTRTPADLLHEPLDKILNHREEPHLVIKRIERLLHPERINRFPLEEEHWYKAGISILTRRDKNKDKNGGKGYPRSLETKLKYDSPALVFMTGNPELLAPDQKKIIILGFGQDAGEIDMNYAHSIVTKLVQEDAVLICTDLTEIEHELVMEVLKIGGKCIVVLPGKLQELLSSGTYNEYLDKNLVLLSASPPHIDPCHAAFKQHYDIACALSTAVIIVRSVENDMISDCVGSWLKRGDLPIWVRKSEEDISGNQIIVRRGGHWLSNGTEEDFQVRHILNVSGQLVLDN